MALLMPNRYTSTTRLMPPDQGSGTGMMGMLAALAGKGGGNPVAALGGELLGLKTTGDLFVGILQSRSLQDDVISKIDLRKVYGDKLWEDARKDLASRVVTSTDRKSGIITIEVSDRSPQRAQQIGREYVSMLNQVVTSLNTSSAHRERVFLEERLNSVQQDLESAERDFSQFASKNTTIDIQAQGKAMIEAGAALAGELVAAQTELEGLRQIYTSNNVRVRSIQARVDELRRQLEKLGGDAGGDPAAGQDAGALYPPIRKLPLLGVTYADLYRRTKVQEAVFETLTQEYELAKVQEAKETPSVKVLDPADFPERKSSPSPFLIVVGGTLLAAALGGAMVVGKKRWQEVNPEDPGKIFASEVLSTVRTQLPWVFSRNGSAGRNGNGP
jgi:capsule polysaccharide export protein KpsE/RkpR